jgi:hypothetical protein
MPRLFGLPELGFQIFPSAAVIIPIRNDAEYSKWRKPLFWHSCPDMGDEDFGDVDFPEAIQGFALLN